MKVRDFLVQIPFLCGAKNAARISEVFGFIFDRELENDTPWDRNDYDKADFDNRSAILWDMLYSDIKADVNKIHQCKKLVEIIERSHYLDNHNEKYHARVIEDLYKDVETVESEFPTITAAMPVSAAVALGGWNF
jgi:hypothetical protein